MNNLNSNNTICIIPARGGSKRIPNKNIRDFSGQPVISYAIEAALNCELFDEVMVSTDSPDIAEIAKNLGACVPFYRSQKNSDDYAGTDDVLKEVLDRYTEKGRNFDFACCIYPVNPFVTKERLKEGLEQLKTKGFDSVFTGVRYSYPVQRSFRINDEGKIYMIQPEHFESRSQDLEPTFHDAAQFYWFKTDAFQKNGRIWGENTGIIELNELEVQDIDNETDWKLAELKYEFLNHRNG